MADDVVLSAAVGVGDTIAADEISSKKYQRIKLIHGADGVNVGDVSSGNPLPVTDAAAETSLASIDTKTPALGQALAAASVPVVLTAAQLSTITPPAAITGFATETTLDARTGSLTETAPATDTASSGLNGRLQRIAQRLTSLIALLPSALTGSGNLKTAVQESLPAGTNNIGDVDVLTVPADPFGANADAASATGSISAKLRFIASTGIPVTGTVTVGSHAVTNAGTFATQAACAGDTAHDAADGGNPTKAGAKASTALSALTLVADADRTNLHAGADGVLYVRNYCLEDVVQERTTNTDGNSTAFASGLAAPGSGIRLWIKSVDIANSSASFCTVDLRDGSGGSVLWTLPVPATGGVCKVFDPPLRLSANTALAFDASAATSTLSISANGFKSKV